MISKCTNSQMTKKPVQTASSDLMLANGVLVPRVTTQGARRADEDGPQLPIVTALKTVFFNMSTARASQELAAIATLTLASTDGIGAGPLAVDGAMVVPSASAVGGKVVIYSTAIGDMVLNGSALTPAAESLTPQMALQRAASGVFPNTGDCTSVCVSLPGPLLSFPPFSVDFVLASRWTTERPVRQAGGSWTAPRSMSAANATRAPATSATEGAIIIWHGR